MKWRRQIGAAGYGLFSLVITAALAAQTASFKVPYAVPFDPNSTLKVKLGFNAGPDKMFVVDTGSVGIVVPKAELPLTITKAVDGSIRYTSSGLVVDGFWTEPIDINLDPSGAVAHVPVFAATASHCGETSSNQCHDGSLPHMMGVGFGRPDTYASPDRNPLLHIRNLPAGRASNYRITHTGIELGVDHALAIKGMHTIQLTPWTRSGLHNEQVIDYNTPPGVISLNRGRPQPVSILIDTGLTDALIALATGEPNECTLLPRKANAQCVLMNGTRISLGMLHGEAQLDFTLGDQGAATPQPAAHWIHLNPQEGSFINIGIRPLTAFDVFYDSTKGIFGLNPAGS